jgi:hypothetical protein
MNSVPSPRILFKLASPKKVLGLASAGMSLLAVARVVVLVVESYSAVWSERQADRELMDMCNAGTALMSSDFRALCLKKRAEQSAPIVFKALLRACTTAFTDFCELFTSPTKIVLLILFCLTGVAAPVVKALATLMVDNFKKNRRRWRFGNGFGRGIKGHGGDDSGCEEDESDGDDHGGGRHEIVVLSPRGSMNEDGELINGGTAAQAFGMRLRRSVRQLRRGSSFRNDQLLLDDENTW